MTAAPGADPANPRPDTARSAMRGRDVWGGDGDWKNADRHPTVRFRLALVGAGYSTWMRWDRRWTLRAEKLQDAALRAMCWAFGHYFIPGFRSGVIVVGVGVVQRSQEPPFCSFCLTPLPCGDPEALQQADAF